MGEDLKPRSREVTDGIERAGARAMLRAIGAKRRQVLKAVIIESAIVGLVASAVGLVAGVGMSYGLRALLGGAAALLYAGYAWLLRRDWRAGLAVVGVLTTWVPFFPNADRPIFSFYVITALPFTIAAVCLVLGRLLGPAERTSHGDRHLMPDAAGVTVVLGFPRGR